MVEAFNWNNEQRNTFYIRVKGSWDIADFDGIVQQAATLCDRANCPLNVVMHFDTDFVPNYLLSQYATFARSKVFAVESPINQLIVISESSFIRAMVELMQRLYPSTSEKLSLISSLAEADTRLDLCGGWLEPCQETMQTAI